MRLLTPVSEPVLNVLSDGTNHFAPYGSLNNHHLIGGISTESQSDLSTLKVLWAALWGMVRNGYRERPTVKMTPPTIVQNLVYWRNCGEGSKALSQIGFEYCANLSGGVVKWEGENGTRTPLTKIAAI